ncbi:Gfo/Idh/MocA family protein [Nonomuraea thailandensis]
MSLAIVGAGDRGTAYARWALAHPEQVRIVAVADPSRDRALPLARESGARLFPGWRQLADEGRIADAVVIATQDADHAEPATAFAELGYHLLVEKPLAPTEAECRDIVAAVEKAG